MNQSWTKLAKKPYSEGDSCNYRNNDFQCLITFFFLFRRTLVEIMVHLHLFRTICFQYIFSIVFSFLRNCNFSFSQGGGLIDLILLVNYTAALFYLNQWGNIQNKWSLNYRSKVKSVTSLFFPLLARPRSGEKGKIQAVLYRSPCRSLLALALAFSLLKSE